MKLAALGGAVVLIGFIAYVVVSSGADTRNSAPTAPPSLAIGTAAPTFAIPRLGGGSPVTLSSTRGRPTILNFFASWCPDCRAEIASIASTARASGTAVNVIGVDSNDPQSSTVASLLAAEGATYPVGVDARAAVATRYRLDALPVTYFLDDRGRVVGVTFGTISAAALDRWVERLTRAPR